MSTEHHFFFLLFCSFGLSHCSYIFNYLLDQIDPFKNVKTTTRSVAGVCRKTSPIQARLEWHHNEHSIYAKGSPTIDLHIYNIIQLCSYYSMVILNSKNVISLEVITFVILFTILIIMVILNFFLFTQFHIPKQNIFLGDFIHTYRI